MRYGLMVLCALGLLLMQPACEQAKEKIKENQDAAKDGRARAEMEMLKRGLDVVAQTGSGKYPPSYADVGVKEDPWGNPYVYTQLQGGKSYEIRSYGADGEADTNDDIVTRP